MRLFTIVSCISNEDALQTDADKIHTKAAGSAKPDTYFLIENEITLRNTNSLNTCANPKTTTLIAIEYLTSNPNFKYTKRIGNTNKANPSTTL